MAEEPGQTRVVLDPGDVLVFWVPEGYSETLLEITKHAASSVAAAHPDAVVMVLPDALRLEQVPSASLRNLARKVIEATGG